MIPFPMLSKLPPAHRKVYCHIIRECAKINLPDWVREDGLEKAEENIIGLIQAERLVLMHDKTRDLFWLEEVK